MDRPEQIKFAPGTYGHSSACDLQIIFAPGTYGHCLRWLLDRFSPETKFKNIDSPWHQNNSVHYTFPDEMYSSKFCLGHQLNGSWGELTENVNNVVISYGLEDLLTVERLGYYRAGGWDTNEKRYKLIIGNADKEFVGQTFGNLDRLSGKFVAKELKKIEFHDHENQTWWKAIQNHMDNKANFQLQLDSLLNKDRLIQQISDLSERFNLKLNIEEHVIENVVKKISQDNVIITRGRAKDLLECIEQNKMMECSDFDILEQAWVETVLEKTNDSLLFPYGNFFNNSFDIIEFLRTYPSYLKHMNPRLPWYNKMQNPFYLTGKIDKSK